MRILNLYAGIGGNRKLWNDCEVTAVEIDPKIAKIYQENFPDDSLVIGDAHDYLEKHFQEFDFIWSSPPCQSHSKMDRANYRNAPRYANMALYEEIILLETYFQGLYVVENVVPYYGALLPATKIGRHLFWTNFEFDAEDVPRPKDFINTNRVAQKQGLMDWLGIHYQGNIYYNGNHCPLQILRNCVHPKLGIQILNQARNSIAEQWGY